MTHTRVLVGRVLQFYHNMAVYAFTHILNGLLHIHGIYSQVTPHTTMALKLKSIYQKCSHPQDISSHGQGKGHQALLRSPQKSLGLF